MIVAKILKPQGIKGELKLEPLLPDANQFFDLKHIFIDGKSYEIKSVRIHEQFVFLCLNEVVDRNFAETLRGKMIEVSKDDLKPLQQDFYYIQDLVDCEVFFEDGSKFGKVKEVQNFGASDILVLKTGSEEVWCPFLKRVFKDVDIQHKRIVADRKKFLEVTESED